jgi:hypothetical protein
MRHATNTCKLVARPATTLVVVAAWVIASAAAPAATAREWVVDVADPRADDAGDGTAARPFRSIAPAARAAQPGDTVIVRPGVYRERVAPERGGEAGRPIVYRAAERGRAVVKGSDVFAPKWMPVAGAPDVFRGALDAKTIADAWAFRRGLSVDAKDNSKVVRPAAEGALAEVLGEVVVDGAAYAQVTDEAALRKREKTWLSAAGGDAILIHFPAGTDPAARLVEVTTRDRVFAPHRRGLGHVHVDGLVFEQCANQGPFPQAGAVSTRSGHHWVIERNVIRLAATIGLDCGGEYWDGAAIPDTRPEDRKLIIGGGHVIRDNDVSDNGVCGIAGWSFRDGVIEGNRVERNNRREFPRDAGGWEEWAGIKLHNTNAVVRGNLIRDNRAFGVWIDNGHADAVIDANVILRNRGAGVFIELGAAAAGHAARVTNNVIGGTAAGGGFYGGYGVYTHDASDVCVAHNLVFDSAGPAVLMRTISDRKAGGKLAETSRSRILNNLFVNNAGGALSLPYPNERSAGLASDGNVVWAEGGRGPVSFEINHYQDRIKMADVAAELVRRLTAANVPANRIPDPVAWAKRPVLDFDQWRTLTGMDRGSAVARVAVECDDAALPATLTVTVDPAALDVAAAPVDGVTTDFANHPIPKERPHVGPWQDLRPGANRIVLGQPKP